MKRAFVINDADAALLRSLLMRERDVAINRRMFYERLSRTVDDNSYAQTISGYYRLMKRCNRLLELLKSLS